MTVYRIAARCIAQPPAADWREQLASRLGSRPRRLGRWAELGIYGALECLAAAEKITLTPHATLVLSSQHGPALAMRSALAQAREDLPLPLTFLQTQPSQLLAALSAQLQWCGDARFITHPDPLAVLALSLAIAQGVAQSATQNVDQSVKQSHADDMLLGWVNELEVESSVWLYLQAVVEPVGDPEGAWQSVSDFETVLRYASHVKLLKQDAAHLKVIIAPQYIHANPEHGC